MNPPDQPTLAPTPRTDEAYFATGATMYSLAGEMKLLERELTAAKEECERLRPHSLSAGEREDYHDALNELTRLRAEVEHFKDCAFDKDGTPWKTVCGWWSKKYDAAERNMMESAAHAASFEAEAERLKGALALGQQNCDDAYDDLREERDEAIARA
jgi:hypothetical protein